MERLFNMLLYGFGIWWIVAEVLCFGDFIYQIIRKTKEGRQLHSHFWRNVLDIFIWAPFYGLFLLAAWFCDLCEWIHNKIKL